MITAFVMKELTLSVKYFNPFHAMFPSNSTWTIVHSLKVKVNISLVLVGDRVDNRVLGDASKKKKKKKKRKKKKTQISNKSN